MSRWLPFILTLTLLPLASAQSSSSGQIFENFRFTDLAFQFHPTGLENRQDTDGKGSAITVHVARVSVTGANALDLRHCIDGDTNWCPYSIPPTGNNDGTITADELASFQQLVQIGLRKYVPKVNELLNTLQTNITVDGTAAILQHVKITKATFDNAIGKVDRNDTILADIDAKVTYDNDLRASKHSIHLGNLHLAPDFTYDTIEWTFPDAGWRFDTKATNPAGAKQFMSAQGWSSAQTPFEDLTGKGVDLSAVKSGGKRSPGLEPVVSLAAVAALVVLRRRA